MKRKLPRKRISAAEERKVAKMVNEIAAEAPVKVQLAKNRAWDDGYAAGQETARQAYQGQIEVMEKMLKAMEREVNKQRAEIIAQFSSVIFQLGAQNAQR